MTGGLRLHTRGNLRPQAPVRSHGPGKKRKVESCRTGQLNMLGNVRPSCAEIAMALNSENRVWRNATGVPDGAVVSCSENQYEGVYLTTRFPSHHNFDNPPYRSKFFPSKKEQMGKHKHTNTAVKRRCLRLRGS